MLFLLVSAQRCQTLHLIHIQDIRVEKDKVYIVPNHILKQSKPGHHLDVICLKAYSDKSLCIVKVLTEYLHRTEYLRSGDKLLISTVKPYKAVSKDTVARWIKLIMLKAGIDPSFKPHSTRAASTTKAKLQGVPLQTIIKTAGWSNASVFARFYNKPIATENDSIQDAVLKLD